MQIKKTVLTLLIIALFFGGLAIYTNRVNKQVEQPVITESTEKYEEAAPYRETKQNIRVLPEEYQVYGEDGVMYLKYLFDSKARESIYGKMGDIGLSPYRELRVEPDGTETPYLNHLYDYDNDGNIIKEQIQWLDSEDPTVISSVQQNTYTYNDRGKMTSMIASTLNENQVFKAQYSDSFIYDENGLLEKILHYDGDYVSHYFRCTCNTNGDPVLMEEYSPDDIYMGKKEMTYAEDGQILTYKETTESGGPVMAMEYVYDSSDYLREIIQTDYSAWTETDDNGNVSVIRDEYVNTIVVVYPEGTKLGEYSPSFSQENSEVE